MNKGCLENLTDGRSKIEAWRVEYNTVGLYGRIGNMPPAAYAKLSASGMQLDGALEQLGGSAA